MSDYPTQTLFIPNVGTKFSLSEPWTTIVGGKSLSRKFVTTFTEIPFDSVVSQNFGSECQGIKVTFDAGTMFEVSKYNMDEPLKGKILLKITWTPLKPKQNAIIYSLWVSVTDFNPQVKVFKKTGVPSCDVFQMEAGEILKLSELDDFYKRSVYVESDEFSGLMGLTRYSSYSEYGLVTIINFVINNKTLTACFPKDSITDMYIENIEFSEHSPIETTRKLKKLKLTIRKPKI